MYWALDEVNETSRLDTMTYYPGKLQTHSYASVWSKVNVIHLIPAGARMYIIYVYTKTNQFQQN